MATKTSPKNAKFAEPKMVKLNIYPTEETITYYSNCAEVSHTVHEFSFAVGRVSSKLDSISLERIGKNEEMEIPAEIQILFSPTVIPGLIDALKAQLEMYEKNFGKVKTVGVANG